jgi:hypothetical protein
MEGFVFQTVQISKMRKHFYIYVENNMVPIQQSSPLLYEAVSVGSFVPIYVVSLPTRLESQSAAL